MPETRHDFFTDDEPKIDYTFEKNIKRSNFSFLIHNVAKLPFPILFEYKTPSMKRIRVCLFHPRIVYVNKRFRIQFTYYMRNEETKSMYEFSDISTLLKQLPLVVKCVETFTKKSLEDSLCCKTTNIGDFINMTDFLSSIHDRNNPLEMVDARLPWGFIDEDSFVKNVWMHEKILKLKKKTENERFIDNVHPPIHVLDRVVDSLDVEFAVSSFLYRVLYDTNIEISKCKQKLDHAKLICKNPPFTVSRLQFHHFCMMVWDFTHEIIPEYNVNLHTYNKGNTKKWFFDKIIQRDSVSIHDIWSRYKPVKDTSKSRQNTSISEVNNNNNKRQKI